MKQVLIVRKDLNMRKGKIVAQCCHATLGIMVGDNISTESLLNVKTLSIDKNTLEWLRSGMKKVCLGCNSEHELFELYNGAKRAGLPAHYVRDAGHTELEPNTVTCLAIGPADEDEMNKITGHLKLL